MTLTAPAASRVWAAPVVTIVVEGVLRTDLRIDAVDQGVDIIPAPLQIVRPNAESGDNALRLGAHVTAWLDRWTKPEPVFIGFVEAVAQSFDPQLGVVDTYTCVDLRQRLNDSVCSRSFNQLDASGRATEKLSSRAVLSTLFAEYRAHQRLIAGRQSSHVLGIDLASVPDVEIGSVDCAGQPHGDAMAEIVSRFGGHVYRLHIAYQSGPRAVLRCMRMGQGTGKSFVRGTAPATDLLAQPWGVPNVGGGDTGRNAAQLVNEVEADGGPRYIETAVRLAPAFDVSLLDTLADKIEGGDGFTAPDLHRLADDPGLATFGRAWIIPPVVDVDGVSRKLDVARELVQTRLNEAFFADREVQRFLVVRYAAEPGEDIVALTGTDGVLAGDDYAITGEQDGAERWVGAELVTGATRATITAQDGNTLTLDDGTGIDDGDWSVVVGNTSDLHVQTTGFQIEDGRLVTSQPLLRKAAATETFDRPALLNRVLVYKSLTGALPKFAMLRNATPAPFDLTPWANGTKQVWDEFAGASGTQLTVHEGQPNDSVAFALIAADPVEGRGHVWIDPDNGYIYRTPAVTIGRAALDNLPDVDSVLWDLLGLLKRSFDSVNLRDTRTEDQWTVPSELWLNAAFVSRVPFVASSGRQGAAGHHVKRRMSTEGFRWLKLRNYFKLTGEQITGDKSAWTVAFQSVDSVALDDTSRLAAFALNQARQTSEYAVDRRRVCPTCPLYFDIGDRFVENGVGDAANIVQIRYDLAANTTTLDVVSR